MPISRTYDTVTLIKDGEEHTCNAHNAQELVDSDLGYIDPKGKYENAKQVEARKKAAEEAEAKRIADEKAEEKRQADALAEQERKDKAKDDEIAELKRQLAAKESAPAAPVKRGGKRPAPKAEKAAADTVPGTEAADANKEATAAAAS